MLENFYIEILELINSSNKASLLHGWKAEKLTTQNNTIQLSKDGQDQINIQLISVNLNKKHSDDDLFWVLVRINELDFHIKESSLNVDKIMKLINHYLLMHTFFPNEGAGG